MYSRLLPAYSVLIFIVLSLNFTSCKKPTFNPSEEFYFSTDTLVFDTVFTTLGSTTKQFKMYNNGKNTMTIDQIELVGGEDSPFRINVDGLSGTAFAEIELQAKDSLFVFVEVTLDVNASNGPAIIEDSIRFSSNGVDKYVHLKVWGRDAYYHNKDTNSGTWDNDKPHIVYGFAGVNPGQSLTIQEGTEIYFYKNSWLYIYKGQLDIQGTKTNPVTLQGIRLEQEYEDVAGQYGGIYFFKALPSSIDYTNIKNATTGIQLNGEDPTNLDFTLEVSNSRISNCAAHGVFIFDGAEVKAENCILSKNNGHSLYVLRGGKFDFNHCHLLGYGIEEGVPAVYVRNKYQDTILDVDGTITNSIVYGSNALEIYFDTVSDPSYSVDLTIANTLIRSPIEYTSGIYSSIIWDQFPHFKSVEQNDFSFWSNSPVIDAGNSLYGITNTSTYGADICGTPRGTSPDLGAYEQ
ncbi:MAG: hypothetical protein ACJA1C_002773 [Crocinitomicaceae bacterium]|jgi:hypothetical protein